MTTVVRCFGLRCWYVVSAGSWVVLARKQTKTTVCIFQFIIAWIWHVSIDKKHHFCLLKSSHAMNRRGFPGRWCSKAIWPLATPDDKGSWFFLPCFGVRSSWTYRNQITICIHLGCQDVNQYHLSSINKQNHNTTKNNQKRTNNHSFNVFSRFIFLVCQKRCRLRRRWSYWSDNWKSVSWRARWFPVVGVYIPMKQGFPIKGGIIQFLLFVPSRID